MIKEPLRMDPEPGAYLESTSRANFGDRTTFEHNLKVFKIGQICQEHLHLLRPYSGIDS